MSLPRPTIIEPKRMIVGRRLYIGNPVHRVVELCTSELAGYACQRKRGHWGWCLYRRGQRGTDEYIRITWRMRS